MGETFLCTSFWCHKNHVPDKKTKTCDKPLLPPPPSSAVHFPRSLRGHRYGNLNHTFKKIK